MVSTIRRNRWTAWVLLLLVVTMSDLLAGCDIGPAAALTPRPSQTARRVQVVATFTPRPAFSPTPVATATPPVPTATATAAATATPTRKPTATNTPKPKPTKTPAPPPTPTVPPFTFVVREGPIIEVNASTTTIKGFVYDAGGNPMNGVGVRLRSDGWSDIAHTGQGADPPGYFSWGLRDYSMNGTWLMCVVNASGNCDSPEITFQTIRQTNQSVVTVIWRRTY